MPDSKQQPSVPDPVRDIESRMRWSVRATIGFLALMVSLLVVGGLAIFAPPRTADGLPDTPDVVRARALLYDQILMSGADLRFRSELTGEWDPAAGVPPEQHSRLARARKLLVAAARDLPTDARTHAALAHAELGLRETNAAALRYRLALEIAPHYAEAHLGLGVALVQSARVTVDTHMRRRLMLQALAQFVAIEEANPLYDCALHNRVIVLLELGRTEDARTLARLAIEKWPDTPWADQLRSATGSDS